jgi:hypothetical protein
LAASIRTARRGQSSRENIELDAKSERLSTGESGAEVAEKPARQAKRFVAVSFYFDTEKIRAFRKAAITAIPNQAE